MLRLRHQFLSGSKANNLELKMNEQILWIWLSLACTPGTESFRKLIDCFQTPESVYAADKDSITSVLGKKCADITALSDKNTDRAREILDFCIRKNIGILNFSDANFPPMLKSIKNPPVLLYYRGVLPDFKEVFCISVVGTRRLSEYGLRNAFSISRDLAVAGATVVSGMAVGVDGVAHAGALSADGITIAVLGSGIDVCYPSDHKMLAREIVKRGCVFTEYAPGTKPEKNNFPRRNRIISALSHATLVIEGKERSGALITARCAYKQERKVYALPGNVGNSNSQLTNLLIKNGASLCSSADDIVRDFEESSLGLLNPFKLAESKKADPFEFLRRYSVSALTSSDRVFSRTKKKRAEAEAPKNTENVKNDNIKAPEPDTALFDKETLQIYKKIPQGEECTIESLVDSALPLRKVMKGLLKLEMGRFIVMLPGEKVKRNF